MTKLKIGDTVRVLDDDISMGFLPKGSITTIVDIEKEGDEVTYRLEDLQDPTDIPWWALDKHIELYIKEEQ